MFRDESLVRLCPSLNGGSPSTIFKSQFHDTLIDMGFRMKDKEFDKLWNKYVHSTHFHLFNNCFSLSLSSKIKDLIEMVFML